MQRPEQVDAPSGSVSLVAGRSLAQAEISKHKCWDSVQHYGRGRAALPSMEYGRELSLVTVAVRFNAGRREK